MLVIFASVASSATSVQITEIARLRESADSLHRVGRTDSAVVVGAKALMLANESGDLAQIVGTHSSQGVFLRSLGRIDEALKSYEDALAIVTSGQFRENPDQETIEEIASLYINLAVLNLDMQHKEEAVKNAEFAGKWIGQSDDPELKSTIFGVVGSVLTGSGSFEKAMQYQDLAYQNALAADNNEMAFRAAVYTMLAADKMGDTAKAESWRKKCVSLLPDVQSMMSLLVYYQAECSICLRGNNQKGALVWFDKILNLDGIDNLPFVKFDCYNNMVQSEARRANTLMWLFATVGLLLAGIIVFVVYANRQRRRRMQKEMEFAGLKADISRQLTQQYVEGLENERRRMSSELHDGVCNDLLAILMNINNGKSIESTSKLIDTCRESVRRISHELMPPEFTYATIDEVVRFFVAKQAEANQGKINVAYRSSAVGAGWSDVPDTVSLEIYRIVQEAVGNAVKHSGAKEIKVSLELNAGTLAVVVKDNGTYQSAGKKGLGLESMKRRAGAINGTITLHAGEDGGTEVRVNVKI